MPDSDISISYKNSSIATMSDSGSVVLSTAGKYLEDNIMVNYTKPSGGGGSGANLYQFHFDISYIPYDPNSLVISSEKLSDYGLTPSDFVVTNTHHVAAWFTINDRNHKIIYSDENDDDGFDAVITSMSGSMVDSVSTYKYGGDVINEAWLSIDAVAIKQDGKLFYINDFSFSTYTLGEYRDGFMPYFIGYNSGFDVTNNDTYSGTGRAAYLATMSDTNNTISFVLNVLIFDEVSS